MLVLELLGKGSCADQDQLTFVPSLGLPGGNYKMIAVGCYFSGPGGTLEKLSCKLRLATTCTGFLEHSTLLKLCSKPTLSAAFVGLEAT